MRRKLRLNAWAGPVTIGSFAVVAVTGALMFFHLNTGLMKLAHEWLGWLLVVGAVAHVAVNWNPFLAYFSRPAGIAILSIFLVLGIASTIPVGGAGPGGRPAMLAASRALEQSPLCVVAQVVQKTPESLVDTLKAKGIRVQDHNKQTIRDIASANKVGSMEIMGHIFPQNLGRKP